MRIRIGNTRLRVGNIRLAVGTGSTPSTPAAVAPSQVGSLSAGTPTNYTIPVTYTAASGTATISYAGRVALHGSTSFTPNSGTFSATGGQFIGLSAGTAYDLQIVATNSAESSTTTLLNIATTTAPVVSIPTPTLNANRYDVALAKSAVAPGGTATGILYPTNGKWNAAGNVVLTPSNGDPAITVTVPTTGSASVPFSYTAGNGASGTVRFALSNTAGLINPEPPTLTVFAASNGTARNISATFAPIDLLGTQRAVPSGDPVGFEGLWGKGWGRGLLRITAIDGATSAIWMQPFAADPHAAPGQGIGAALHAPVQVYGTVSATGSIEVLLPAGIPWIYWKIAGDSAMTNATTIPQRARIGHVMVVLGRSIMNTVFNSYAYGNPIPVFTPVNQNTTTIGTGNNHSNGPLGAESLMLQFDSTSTSSNGYNGASSAAQELGRLCEADLGVGLTAVWCAENGQATDRGIGHDGSLLGSMADNISQACITGFRELHTGWSAAGNDWSDTTYPNTVDERVARYAGLVAKMQASYPALAVISINDSDEGWFGGDGSADVVAGISGTAPGYVRTQLAIDQRISAINPMVVSRTESSWNARFGGHPTMGVRPVIGQSLHTSYRMGEHAAWGGLQIPYGQRGPTLGGAQWIPAQNLIRWFGKLNGGVALKAFKLDGTDQFAGASYDSAGPTAAQLASIIGVWPGYRSFYGNGTPIQTSGVVISTANLPSGYDFSLDISVINQNGNALYWDTGDGVNHGTVSMPSEFTLHYHSFGVSNRAIVPTGAAGSAVFITDTAHIGASNGVPYGLEILPALDVHATTAAMTA